MAFHAFSEKSVGIKIFFMPIRNLENKSKGMDFNEI